MIIIMHVDSEVLLTMIDKLLGDGSFVRRNVCSMSHHLQATSHISHVLYSALHIVSALYHVSLLQSFFDSTLTVQS